MECNSPKWLMPQSSTCSKNEKFLLIKTSIKSEFNMISFMISKSVNLKFLVSPKNDDANFINDHEDTDANKKKFEKT